MRVGGWVDYQRDEVGWVTFKAAGHLFLAIEPVEIISQGLMNVRGSSWPRRGSKPGLVYVARR